MLTYVYLVYACKSLIISDVYNVYDVNAFVRAIDSPPRGMKKAHNRWVMRFVRNVIRHCPLG